MNWRYCVYAPGDVVSNPAKLIEFPSIELYFIVLIDFSVLLGNG